MINCIAVWTEIIIDKAVVFKLFVFSNGTTFFFLIKILCGGGRMGQRTINEIINVKYSE